MIRHIEGTRFSIGEPDGTISERCVRFSEAMVAGGLKCPVEPDIRNDIWVKLMGNVAFNPLSRADPRDDGAASRPIPPPARWSRR